MPRDARALRRTASRDSGTASRDSGPAHAPRAVLNYRPIGAALETELAAGAAQEHDAIATGRPIFNPPRCANSANRPLSGCGLVAPRVGIPMGLDRRQPTVGNPHPIIGPIPVVAVREGLAATRPGTRVRSIMRGPRADSEQRTAPNPSPEVRVTRS